MDLEENPKLQERLIIFADQFHQVSRIWWYASAILIVLSIPIFYILRAVFVPVIISHQTLPAYIYQQTNKMPLTIGDEKIFNLGNGSYGGYFAIKNSGNFDWGVASQSYDAVFLTTGGSKVMEVTGSTYVLPSSEKIVVIPRFVPDGGVPSQLSVTLGSTQFIDSTGRTTPNLNLQRQSFNIVGGQLIVGASITNNTPFTITKIDLPILIYNANNQVVGAGFTNINDVKYGETRSFQVTWPNNPNGVRAEILPQVDIFDPNVYQLAPGQSQFDNSNSSNQP